jgi:hypothetical protein
MSKYLLLTLSILIMPVMAWACLEQNVANKRDGLRNLREKLAKSEYVVDKGELIPRPQAAREVSTPLSHDQEFEVMKKSLDAAKAKLRIPDGAGVLLVDGKEYYEVIIGSSPSAGVPGPDYTAKIMVDKKSLAVAQILVNDMKNTGDEAAQRTAQFHDLQEKLAGSEYVVEKGELVPRPQAARGVSTPLSHDQEFEVMKKSLDAAKAKLRIPDGSGVILVDGKEYYEVIIGNTTPAGTLGPDYTAKVRVDKKSLAVIQILSGG